MHIIFIKYKYRYSEDIILKYAEIFLNKEKNPLKFFINYQMYIVNFIIIKICIELLLKNY
ncbi:hypothetical protein DRF58_00555 [Epilithonimonas hispanica]|uniref:Uncharacterized protein n=1 Tax=Epilithonimonas hispanica TaxID=358687 RepID=A0A3D9D5N6_9FLAO|nr:hypothetical protein DRF58_00555 [Epilithonimonas hispanica]